MWLEYQKKWLMDDSQIKVWDKSRRIGATFVQAFEDVYECVTGITREVWFSSADESAGKEYIVYCTMFTKLFQLILPDREIITNKKNDIQVTQIKYANGARITALSSSPKNFRSKGGKVVIDEFAWHNDPMELWRACSPCIMHGYKMRILSTHNGIDSLFNKFIIKARGKLNKMSYHRTSLQDSINDGLLENIVKINRPDVTEEEFIREIKEDRCPDEKTWLQEYCCNPQTETSLLVVKNFTEDNIKEIPYLPFIKGENGELIENALHITCDFNYSPNCWSLAHVDHENEKVYVFDEFFKDLPSIELIELVLDKYDHNGLIVINGDASGNFHNSKDRNTDYDLIRNALMRRGYKPTYHSDTGKRFRFDLRKANGSRHNRFTAFNKMVCNINGERSVFIDPSCDKLIYNCRNLQIIQGTSNYDLPTRKGIEKDSNKKYLGHGLDPIQYLVNFYFPIKRDIFTEKQEQTILDKMKAEIGKA